MNADRMSARLNEIWLEPPLSGAEAIGDAAAALLGIAFDTLCDRLAAAAAAGGGDAAHVVGMALCVSALDAPTSDSVLRREIGLSWLYIAACRGHVEAAMEVARAISRETAAETPRRPHQALSEVSDHWYKVATKVDRAAGPPVGLEPPPVRRPAGIPRVRQPAPLADVARAAHPAGETLPAAPPIHGRIVLRNGIGDPMSTEGVALAKRYANLIDKPVPCVGKLPAHGEILEAFDKHWPWAMNVGRFLQRQADQLSLAGVGQFSVMDGRAIAFEPILLVGDPGAGKTRLAKWIADLFGVPKVLVPCGGTHDHGGLSAYSRGWSTARACAPVQAMAENNCLNPLMILDEIDKASRPGSQNGSMMATALAMLDNASEYHDSCLMAPVDISSVTYLATANDEKLLDTALLDRFDILRIPRPEAKHVPIILDSMRADVIERLGVHPSAFPEITKGDVRRFRELFEKSSGSLRVLKKAYRSMLGIKAGLQIKDDEEQVRDYLEQGRFLN